MAKRWNHLHPNQTHSLICTIREAEQLERPSFSPNSLLSFSLENLCWLLSVRHFQLCDVFFLAKKIILKEARKKESKMIDRPNKSWERTVPEPEFEKQSHFYDTRMTFRKQELKAPLTCISEEGKQTGGGGATVSYTPEYMNTSSPPQPPLILAHQLRNIIFHHVFYLYEARTSNCTFSMLHISNGGVGCVGGVWVEWMLIWIDKVSLTTRKQKLNNSNPLKH